MNHPKSKPQQTSYSSSEVKVKSSIWFTQPSLRISALKESGIWDSFFFLCVTNGCWLHKRWHDNDHNCMCVPYFSAWHRGCCSIYPEKLWYYKMNRMNTVNCMYSINNFRVGGKGALDFSMCHLYVCSMPDSSFWVFGPFIPWNIANETGFITTKCLHLYLLCNYFHWKHQILQRNCKETK